MTDSPESNNYRPSKKHKPEFRSAHGPKQIRRTQSRAAKAAAQKTSAPKAAPVNTKRRNIITAAAIALVVLLVAFFAYYMIVIAPKQRVLVTIGTQDIQTGYFLKRVVANPSRDVASTLQGLEGEYIIMQQASSLGVAPVTDAAIDDYLKTEAKSQYPDLTTDQYNKWFKDQLTTTGLSASEYRVVASREILRDRVTDALSTTIPATIKQYHVWAINFPTQSAAAAAKTKLDSGTDFGTIATAQGYTNNGDQGFWPLAALPAQLADTVQTIDLNKVSDPITFTQASSTTAGATTTSYVLLKVTETKDNMTITDVQKTTLKNNALLNWLSNQLTGYSITIHDLNGVTATGSTATFDTLTLSYLNSEASKIIAKLPVSTETTDTATTTTTGAAPASTTTTTSP
jgi:hypothetical protein